MCISTSGIPNFVWLEAFQAFDVKLCTFEHVTALFLIEERSASLIAHSVLLMLEGDRITNPCIEMHGDGTSIIQFQICCKKLLLLRFGLAFLSDNSLPT